MFVLHRFHDGNPNLPLEAAALLFGIVLVQPFPLKSRIDSRLNRLPESRTFRYCRLNFGWKVVDYFERLRRHVKARTLRKPMRKRASVEGSGTAVAEVPMVRESTAMIEAKMVPLVIFKA